MFLLTLLLLAVAPLLLLARRLRRREARAPAGEAAVRVVVVGGSFAGLTFCHRLLSRASSDPSSGVRLSVVLVEPRDFFEYTPGILRAVVQPSHHPSLLTELSSLPLHSETAFRLVKGRVSAAALDEGRVTLEGGEAPLPFDHLVLAVGSGYDAHIKAEDDEGPATSQRLQAVQRLHSQLRAARRVLIVGAGLVGVVSGQPTPAAPSLLSGLAFAHRRCRVCCAVLCGAAGAGSRGGDFLRPPCGLRALLQRRRPPSHSASSCRPLRPTVAGGKGSGPPFPQRQSRAGHSSAAVTPPRSNGDQGPLRRLTLSSGILSTPLCCRRRELSV